MEWLYGQFSYNGARLMMESTQQGASHLMVAGKQRELVFPSQFPTLMPIKPQDSQKDSTIPEVSHVPKTPALNTDVLGTKASAHKLCLGIKSQA